MDYYNFKISLRWGIGVVDRFFWCCIKYIVQDVFLIKRFISCKVYKLMILFDFIVVLWGRLILDRFYFINKVFDVQGEEWICLGFRIQLVMEQSFKFSVFGLGLGVFCLFGCVNQEGIRVNFKYGEDCGFFES